MKKMILSVLLAMAMIVPSMAQVTTRIGNTYTVGNENMNKKAYEGYLKNTCPEAFNLFHNGRVLAGAGWGLFAGGIAMDIAGCAVIIAGGTNTTSPNTISNQVLTGCCLTIAGGALEVSSIVMLGVGYSRMHQAADLYNVTCANKTTAYLTPASRGMGVALHF